MATFKMPAMPALGKSGKAKHPCACGCGRLTGGTWFPGDDGRATGWATRIEKGILTLDEVPANERAGAKIMMLRRAAENDMQKATDAIRTA